jgi:hypothetical protein
LFNGQDTPLVGPAGWIVKEVGTHPDEGVPQMRAPALVLSLLCGCTMTVRVDLPGSPDAAVEPPVDAGSVADAGADDAGIEVGNDAGMPMMDAGLPACPPDAGPVATGMTRELAMGATLQSVLAMSAPGDRVHIASGSWPRQTVTAALSGDVFVEADMGASFAGLDCNGCAHLVVRGLKFTDSVNIQPGHDLLFERISIDLGTLDASPLYIHAIGDVPANASHHVTVRESSIHGGARTVFIQTNFSPVPNWNHDLLFVGDDFQCGSHNCFQLSGAADTVIEANLMHDPAGGGGVLTAGATRVQVLRNRFVGIKTVNTSAVQLATPGKEWDNYAGVEYMISSEITVANNVMLSWGSAGLELDATTHIDLVNNTVIDSVGMTTWARNPTDQSGNVIQHGNDNIRLWNNILPNITMDSADPPLTLDATNLVGGDPKLADMMVGTLSMQSPAVDAATVNAQTPTVDFYGLPRGAKPDIGAIELGAAAACR